MRFGRQEVIANSDHKGYVIVQCDCGNLHEIRKDSLTGKHRALSCGCLRKEMTSDLGKNKQLRNMSDKPNKRNKIGIKGISYDEKHDIYVPHICANYKKYYLGRYKDLNEAIKVRKQAEEELFFCNLDNENAV